MLTEESKKRVKELCDQIAKEQDHRRFLTLLSELNRALNGTGSSNSSGEKSTTALQSGAPQKPH